MKGSEKDYLDKLFAASSDATDEAEVDFPLVDVPEGLGDKLYAIADSTPVSTAPVARRYFKNWPKLTSIAATFLIAVIGFQFYQQQQTLKQLEQAQTDLATALHYLGEANRITREQVQATVRENMRNAGVRPAIEIGRELVPPQWKEPEPENETRTRTL